MNLSSNVLCHCKNSIKLRILEMIHHDNTPIIMDKLIEKIFLIVKDENRQIEIDDSFLKTYIRSIISEMADSKLLKLYQLKSDEIMSNKTFYYAILANEINIDKKTISEDLHEIIIEKQSNQNFAESSNKNSLKENEESLEIKDIKNDPEYRNKLMDEIVVIRKKIDKLKKDNPNKKLHEEIHKYNEIKDIGQELIGYIANCKGLRVKDLYDDLGISDDDK